MMHQASFFSRFARWTAHILGQPVALAAAVLIVLIWGIAGPIFHFSDTWQLVINTGTTIVTFLMVFLIQNTQNRDSEAIQLKLDELIRAVEGAHNRVVNIEELSEQELNRIKAHYAELARAAREDLRQDTGTKG